MRTCRRTRWRPARPPRSSSDYLNDYAAVARPVVEVDQHQLLPGAGDQPPFAQRDGLRGADDRRAYVGVGVGVGVEPVVLVVASPGDKAVEHRAQVVQSTGFELHGRDRRGGAGDEEGDRALAGAGRCDEALDTIGEVDDVTVALSGEAKLAGVDGHRPILRAGPRGTGAPGPVRTVLVDRTRVHEDAELSVVGLAAVACVLDDH